jgi:hypothetical protein
MGEGNSMVKVHGFAFGFRAVNVNENDFGGKAAEE